MVNTLQFLNFIFFLKFFLNFKQTFFVQALGGFRQKFFFDPLSDSIFPLNVKSTNLERIHFDIKKNFKREYFEQNMCGND